MTAEIRSPQFNAAGAIDLEYNHPVHGWIPFTADPTDVAPLGAELYQLALTMNPAPYVPPPLEVSDFQRAVDRFVEESARSWSYNGAEALASYVNSTVPAWTAEAQVFVAWRDSVWLQVLQMFQLVQLGQVAPPPSTEALIQSLPPLVRPT